MLKMRMILIFSLKNYTIDGMHFALGFHKWFVEVQANSFHTCMIAPVHEKAKLGSPPPRYTTNSNESANSTVKRWVGFSKSSWPGFIRI